MGEVVFLILIIFPTLIGIGELLHILNAFINVIKTGIFHCPLNWSLDLLFKAFRFTIVFPLKTPFYLYINKIQYYLSYFTFLEIKLTLI